jgi:hypothetical protein
VPAAAVRLFLPGRRQHIPDVHLARVYGIGDRFGRFVPSGEQSLGDLGDQFKEDTVPETRHESDHEEEPTDVAVSVSSSSVSLDRRPCAAR